MRVFITGATGLVGRALTLRLRRDGHSVVAWSRSADRVAQKLGGEAKAASGDQAALARAVDGCDAVVALAGEPVLPGRWTTKRKAALRSSRVDLNARLVEAILAAEHRPSTIVAASAVGFYGSTSSTPVTEEAGPGKGFLADLCRDWEAAFQPAVDAGVRVVWGRIGIVLARGGGALGPLLPLTRLGVGGPLGSGRQGIPWIHIDDLIEALVLSITRPDLHGPVNMVGPASVPQRDFARAIGRAVGMPAILPAPAFAMRTLLGEAATALLEGQFVAPAKLDALGFQFAFTDLDTALADITAKRAATVARFTRLLDVDAGLAWLRDHPPSHELVSKRLVPVPTDQVWSFFSDARNLAALSPADAGLTLDPALPPMAVGARFTHTMALGPVSMPWEGEIVAWEPGERFVDIQRRGPFGCWWHEHRFTPAVLPDGTRGTELSDRVLFRSPLGVLGTIATALFVRAQLLEMFAYRDHALRLRFGDAPAPRTASGEAA